MDEKVFSTRFFPSSHPSSDLAFSSAEEKEIQANIAYLKLQYKDRDERWLHQTAEAIIIQEKIFDMLGFPLAEK